jgi:hypothetical protein
VKAGGKIEDGGDVSPKRRLTFNKLRGVMSQKIVLFITYDVITTDFYEV